MDEELRKIWWIASFPKSGNTLVRMFLNAYVTRFPLDINANFQYTIIDQQPNLYQQVAAKPLNELHPAEVAYLRPAMLMHYLQLIWPRDACFKTHNANVQVDGIPLIPQRLTKQAVYLIRDPRDVVISYARHSGIDIDATIDIMGSDQHYGKREYNIHDVILSWSNHVRSWQRAKFPVMFVKFEDLVLRREETFRRILPALGLRDIDENAFAHALQQTEFRNLKKLEQDCGFKEARHDSFFGTKGLEESPENRIGQWQSMLSDSQVSNIIENHRNVMVEFDYLEE